MVENSSAGLVMLGSEVSVTVTGEDQHQPALAQYRPGSTVAVELGWCAIRSGKYRGEQAIEVRLDGRRVGELTHLMTRRYGPLVARVMAAGGRPGCAATIHSAAAGLEITLRLPRNGDGPVPLEEPTVLLGGVPAEDTAPRRRRLIRPLGIAAAVITLVVVLAAIGDDEKPGVAGGPATTTTSVTKPQAPPPAPSTTTAAPKPEPEPITPEPPATPKPEPEPVRPEPPAAPPPAPKPAPAPAPASACHPNYGGCVPVAEDVDCLGGRGNGPEYVQGPVEVIGADVYDLDSNDDGVACERN
ncbi:hypothetical protein [Actinophytocola xanthii]|uniref:hypothetical protein n=1 Tax=Actinophytocola xanthii TaxID=1912961 RepID=UPI000ACC5DC9|nr:hypothetical protein [Actinophytocola xanthii]